MPPDFLVIGAVARDLLPGGGWRLGGSVAYAAFQASRLGLETVAVTSCGPDVSPAEAIPSVRWHVIPSLTTTTFENTTVAGRRHQRLLATCTPIEAAHVPTRWQEAPLVLLGPVFDEVDPHLGAIFPPTSHVGLGAQGWLRRRAGNEVSSLPIEGDEPWLIGDTLFVSDEDTDAPERVELWRKQIATVVLTRGYSGCTLWSGAGCQDVAAFPTKAVDTTGAGDVFAAAFLMRYHEAGDPAHAAAFGACAASCVVEGVGASRLGSRAEVERRLGLRERFIEEGEIDE
jgi:sugar/nucleoside kinase (ribokinase family)